MKIKKVDPHSLRLAPDYRDVINKITSKEFKELAKSIEAIGIQQAILVKDSKIQDGMKRWLIAIALGKEIVVGDMDESK